MFVILMAGYAGTGKTTAARMLAPMIDAAMPDKDSLTRPLADELCRRITGDPDDRESAQYREIVRPLEYACLMRTLADTNSYGTSAVAAAPFTIEMRDPSWLSDLRGKLAEGTDLWTVWVHSDADTMRRRITERAASRDRAKLADWPAYAAGLDLAPPKGIDLVLDNSREATTSLPKQVRALATRIATGRDPLDY